MSYNFLDKTGLAHLWDKIKAYILKNTAPLVNGTQTASTSAWTGVAPFSELVDGQVINYYLPYASTNTAVTLNLTLSDGSTTGALPVYYSSGQYITDRITTHFGRGQIITLIFKTSRVNQNGTTVTNSWASISNRDTTDISNLSHSSGTYLAGTNLYRYMICFSKNETTLLPVNAVNNSTATTKALTAEEFNPFGQILYYNTTTNVTANNAITSVWALRLLARFDLRYSFNTGTTLTTNKDVFIKCTPQSNGMVKLDTSKPIVQDLPTTADGSIYIYLGHAYSNYQIEMYPEHPVYEFKDGALRLYKGPSEAVYTSTEKTKLAGIATGATANTGTVTSVAVKMNNATKGTVTTSGTIDLGTVITTVDNELDSSVSATNPVQNWVISSAIDALGEGINETYEMIPQIIYSRLNNSTISSATIDSIVDGTYGS